MANYVYINDGQIEEYYDIIPTSWRNVSGLNLLSKQELLTLGWYPVENLPEIYDSTTSYIAGYTYEIHSDHVKQIPQIVDYSEDKVAELLEERKTAFFDTLRAERSQLLTASDWTQLTDVLDTKSEEWIAAWRTYRQELRDLPDVYANTTEFDSSIIEWPTAPTD
jgi:hypothetical protein